MWRIQKEIWGVKSPQIEKIVKNRQKYKQDRNPQILKK